MNTPLFTGIGKRKTARAKAFFQKGSGQIFINKIALDTYLAHQLEETNGIKKPLVLLNRHNEFDIFVQVQGGGVMGQLEAIKLAIAKACAKIDFPSRQILSQHLLLRRDSRIKERRKYGLRKARKAPQYSKR
jgi:small subunit ribosomal protein S9